MNYVTELEGMEGHPDDLKLKLLRSNIEEAEMLFVVYGFNAKSWIEEFNLAFTEIETQELLVNNMYNHTKHYFNEFLYHRT